MPMPNYHQIGIAQKFELAQKLGTTQGFYLYYFAQLSSFTGKGSQTKCFNTINELHFDIFNQYKYEDYNSFRISLRYHLKVKT